jgi:hypothetical protein
MRKHGVSMHKQAVLIQDVLSFREYLRPLLQPLFEPYGYQGFLYEEAVAFIIRELIWQNTQCIVTGHNPNCEPYSSVYDRLRMVMVRPTLEMVFKQLIKVPIVYGDAELVVALNGRDLTIMYFIPQPLEYR